VYRCNLQSVAVKALHARFGRFRRADMYKLSAVNATSFAVMKREARATYTNHQFAVVEFRFVR
jgi:hypothetical protein